MPRSRGRANGEGSIFRDKAGRWQVEISLPNGRRRRRVAKSRADANKVLLKLHQDLERGLSGDGSLTLDQWLEEWSTRILPGRGASPKTVANYRDIARLHLSPTLGGKRVERLTIDDIEAALIAMADRGLSRSTVVRAKSVLNAALREAERRGHVLRNVAGFAVLPTTLPTAKQGGSLSVDNARQLIGAAKEDRLAPMWMLALLRGLRPGELTGLTWADVDLDRSVVHLRESLKVEPGSQRRRSYRLGPLKSGATARTITIPSELVEAFKRWKCTQADEAVQCGEAYESWFPEHGGLCFVGPSGHPITPEGLRTALRRLTEAAGLDEHVTPYALRHAAVSLLSHAGVPPEGIADLVGHVSTRMVLGVYRHAVTPTVTAGPELDQMLLQRTTAEPVAE